MHGGCRGLFSLALARVVSDVFRLSSNMLMTAAALAAMCTAVCAQPQAQQTPPTPKLRVQAEFRERAEGVENFGFNDARADLYYLSRLRLNVTTASKYAVATMQAQDARVARKTVGPTGAPFKAAPRWSASSMVSSTRAATATASPACT